LAIGSVIYQQLNPFSTAEQQTIVSGSTRVVVVLIPGFPIESIALGALVGVFMLYVLRSRRESVSERLAR
jgi:type III secretory pathway component EscV